jgi:hypothetical protein
MGIQRPMSIIDEIFQPIYGKPCWEVKQGYGSFLTFEFGEPHLHIREPHQPSDKAPESVRRNAARRLVFVHGDWHLWIYVADWRISLHDQELATQSSTRRVIRKAIGELDGQELVQVRVADGLVSTFEFDLGGKMEVIPNRERYGVSRDLWLLYEPSGAVFTLRSDRQYSHIPGETGPEEEIWNPLELST